MNAANRNWNTVLFHIGSSKRALSQMTFIVLGGLLLTSFTAQAAITVNFGPTAQNLTLTGRGPNASGLGQFFVTMGGCSASGANTTCTFSGAFTSAAVGLTSGTFSLVTVYVGTGSTPLEGVQKSAGSDQFTFSSIPSTTTMTLTLASSSQTLVVPLFAGGQFVPGTSFNFAGVAGTQSCTGTAVPSCSQSQVGQVAGAIFSGLVTGTASFGNDYYLSHLAFAGGWQSTLTFVNYSPQQVTCTTNFYSDTGSPLFVPFGQGTISTRTETIPPGGSVHDQTTATLAAAVVQGWAQAFCTGPVQVSLLFRFYSSGTPTGEAGVNAETAATTKFATFAQTATGVAYANPSTTQSATITIAVYSATGTQLGSKVITLGPLGHGAANLGPLLGLSSFTGFVKITSTIPVLSLSLNAEAFPVFSALPPGDLPISTALVP